MSAKQLTLLGFAAKAGKLSFGFKEAVSSAEKGRAKLIIACRDVSEKSRKETAFFSNKYNIPHIVFEEDMQTVSSAVGRKCGVLSVNDRNFAQSILSQEET